MEKQNYQPPQPDWAESSRLIEQIRKKIDLLKPKIDAIAAYQDLTVNLSDMDRWNYIMGLLNYMNQAAEEAISVTPVLGNGKGKYLDTFSSEVIID